MGKKTRKSAVIKHESKENAKKLSMTKRNELNSLVNSLLKLCFIQTTNPNDTWTQYLEIYNLLERIKTIESEISVLKRGNRRTSTTIQDFKKFMLSNGANIEDVEISEFPEYDLGLRASRNFRENELFITVPDNLVFTFDKAPENIKNAAKTVSLIASMPNISLAFFLMIERINPDSFWKPYLDILPDRYSTVMYMTPNDLIELKGSSALNPALNQIKNIARQYAVLYQYQQLENDPNNHIGNLLNEITYDLYCWSVSTVMTRQNLVPIISSTTENLSKENPITKPALIPYWDMANHTNGHLTTTYNIEKHQVESFTLNKCQKGDQIFIYYGNRNNTDLLVHNGFIFENNKNEAILTRLSMSTSDKLFAERSRLLENLEIPVSGEIEAILPGPKFISSKLLGFARVFSMSKEQLDHWIQSDQTKQLLQMNCPFDTEYELKAWNFIVNRLELLIKIHPTSLEDDNQLMLHIKNGAKSSKINKHKHILIQFRVIEKTLLTNSLKYAKQQFDILNKK